VSESTHFNTAIGKIRKPPFWLIQLVSIVLSIALVSFLGTLLQPGYTEELMVLFQPLAVLFLVLLVWTHEIGHRIALTYFKIPVIGPYMLIPIGGIIIPKRQPTPKEYVVAALAGPLTGVLSIPMYLLGVWLDYKLLVICAFVWAFINLFNLFPLLPFDGGLVIREIASSINSKLRKKFKVFSYLLILLPGLLSIGYLIVTVVLLAFLWLCEKFTTWLYQKLSDGNFLTDFVELNRKQAVLAFTSYLALVLILAGVSVFSLTYALIK
jgi:Zn-dependent protease